MRKPIWIRTCVIPLILLILSLSFGLKPAFSQSTLPGDANGDGRVDGLDYVIWLNHFNQTTSSGPTVGDFNNSGKVDGLDYVMWLNYFGETSGTTPTPVPRCGDNICNVMETCQTCPADCGTCNMDIAICNPDLGPAAFTTNIDNPYLPLKTGLLTDHEMYNSGNGEKVRFRILPQTKLIFGTDGVNPIQALVLEEYETVNGSWTETSQNWFVQTTTGLQKGTVCYLGEDVFLPGSPNGGGSGSWEDGKNGAHAGIMMPAHPVVGMTYLMEAAPGVAEETAVINSMGKPLVTPAGTFTDTVYIVETGPSYKYYARGIGMIYDDGMKLTKY